MPSIAAATAFGTGSAAAGGTTATVTTPAGSVSGDILVLYVCRGTASTTWTAPNFTSVTGATGASGSCQVVYRILDGSGNDPGASFTLTSSPGGIFGGICMRVTTSAGFDPAPTSGTVNASSSTITAQGITTTINGDLLIWCAGIDAAGGATPAVLSLPGGYADSGAGQANTSSASGTNVGVLCGSITQGSAGPTGNVSGSAATGHVNMAVLLGTSPALVTAQFFPPPPGIVNRVVTVPFFAGIRN